MMLMGAEEVRARLPMAVCIDAVEDAFRRLALGTAAPPSTLAIHARDGVFHIKAGILSTARRQYYVVKSNGNFPGNPSSNGLPTIQGVVVLCDASNGRVLALMDSMELTAIRTAAATGVAARYLARRDSSAAAIIGCGVQARAQVEALACVLPLRSFAVCDVEASRADSLASSLLRAGVVPSVRVAASIDDAVSSCDVCVTCTTSHSFILDAADVRNGMFVAGVGVDNESKRELSPALMARARVVTDMTSQCALIGDLHHAIDAALMKRESVHAELGAVIAGIAAGRQTEDELFVFDSTGIALQDVAAAAAVYEAGEAIEVAASQASS